MGWSLLRLLPRDSKFPETPTIQEAPLHILHYLLTPAEYAQDQAREMMNLTVRGRVQELGLLQGLEG